MSGQILQPLVLCHDTDSNGPGATGRRAQDLHGKESQAWLEAGKTELENLLEGAGHPQV